MPSPDTIIQMASPSCTTKFGVGTCALPSRVSADEPRHAGQLELLHLMTAPHARHQTLDQRNLGRRIDPVDVADIGKHSTQHALDGPLHGRDCRDADPLVDRSPTLVVDTGNDSLDAERLTSDTCDHDVAVVAVRDGREGLGLLDAGLAKTGLVEPDALDLRARETVGKPAERLGLPIDHGDGVTLLLERCSQARSDSPASDDNDVHHTPPRSGPGAQRRILSLSPGPLQIEDLQDSRQEGRPSDIHIQQPDA